MGLPIGPGNTDLGSATLGVGSNGAGTLTVNGGSLFDLGTLSMATGGTGSAVGVIEGASSRIRLRGDGNSNRFSVANWGVASFTISGGAELAGRFNASACTTGAQVGRNGGAVGIMNIDNATVRMSGQQTGNALAGAAAVIGSGLGSTDVLNMSNNALLDINNAGGTVGVSFNAGGSSTASGGDGILQMNSGSRIQLTSPTSDGSSVSIGRDGGAFARLRGASSIDVGAGNLYVGRFTSADGTLIVSEASTVTAGWVGVGRNKTGTGSVDGGTGTCAAPAASGGLSRPRRLAFRRRAARRRCAGGLVAPRRRCRRS